MEFRILGPLEVIEDQRSVPLGPPKQRMLLAALLLRPNQVVSNDELIDALWGQHPPDRAAKSLHVYIWQLRKLLGPEVLKRRPPGYMLSVSAEDLDLGRFESLCDAARSTSADEAAVLFREALQLFRGRPLADFAYEPFADAESARLEELRLQALENRVRVDLELGRHAELVGELESLVAAQPLREQLRAQLMLALYRCGRQAEALAAYQEARDLLVDQLGIDPGRELKALQTAILRHDPSLDHTPTVAPPVPRKTGIEARETRYARSGDVSIAYQVVGEGPFDLVFVGGFLTHVEYSWLLPSFAPTLERFASFSRLILFDKRGTGMSDRVSGAPTLERRMDDLRAVLDAAGSSRAAIFASSEGAAMALLFVATHPERAAALVLRSASPRTMWAPDFPWGRTEEQYRLEMEHQLAIFGPRAKAEESVGLLGEFAPEETGPLVDYWRQSASPGAVEALALMNKQIDVRDVLPAIRVPTLILHGTDDEIVPVEVARYTTEHIPGAQLVEIDGAGHLAVGRSVVPIAEHIERFLTELWESGGWDAPELERVLSTVLFTDIVGSTEEGAKRGDQAWRELLGRYQAAVRRQLSRFRGRELETTGDGFFATFDRPARAIHCAQAIIEAVRDSTIELRTGIHTGECEVIDGKIVGIAVHTGARVASLARPGEVLVSSTVKDLVAGSGIPFQDRGKHELEGVPGEWNLFAVGEEPPG